MLDIIIDDIMPRDIYFDARYAIEQQAGMAAGSRQAGRKRQVAAGAYRRRRTGRAMAGRQAEGRQAGRQAGIGEAEGRGGMQAEAVQAGRQV